jgi:hypothetical protein
VVKMMSWSIIYKSSELDETNEQISRVNSRFHLKIWKASGWLSSLINYKRQFLFPIFNLFAYVIQKLYFK